MIKLLARGPEFVGGQILASFAKKDTLHTTLKEGQGAIITKNGQFVRPIMSFQGFHFNEPGTDWFDPNIREWEIIRDDPTKPKGYYDRRLWMQSEFGLHWLGLPGMREVFDYEFEWSEKFRTHENGDVSRVIRHERTRIFFVAGFPYIIMEEEAKTADNYPVKLVYMVALRIVNPKVALFETVDWLKQAEGFINRVGRSFAGEFTYNELRSETDETDAAKRRRENFSLRVKKLNTLLLDEQDAGFCPAPNSLTGMIGHIGVAVDSAELLKVVLSGPNAQAHEQITLRETIAKADARAKVLTADADAYSAVMAKGAEAKGIQAIGKAQAEATNLQLEALSKHPELAGPLLQHTAIKPTDKGYIILDPVTKPAADGVKSLIKEVFGKKGA